MVRGPMMGAVTAGLRSSQASATSAGSSPRSVQRRFVALELRRGALDPLLHVLGCCGALRTALRALRPAARRPAGSTGSRRARSARQAGSTSSSTARGQVVQALLGDQAQEVALRGAPRSPARCASRRSCCCPRRAPCPRAPAAPSPARSPPTACAAVDVVHLVEVDVVGLQPAQAVLAGAPDVVGGQAALVGPVAHPAVDLGGQHDPLAPSAALRQPAADDLLGDALAASSRRRRWRCRRS